MTKTVKRTIHYVYTDGTTASKDVVQTVTFTRTATIDEVTGEGIYTDWTPSQLFFDDVSSPVIKGYTPDQATVMALAGITIDSSDSEVTVVYTPEKTTIVTPDNGGENTETTTPNQVTPQPGKSTESNNKSANGQETNKKTSAANAKQIVAKKIAATTSSQPQYVENSKKVPQTGEQETSHLTVWGAIMLAISSLLGLLGLGKRQRKE